MLEHASSYASLSLQHRLAYDAAAEGMQAAKQMELEQEIAHLRARLSLLRSRVSANVADQGLVNTIASCKLTPAGLATLRSEIIDADFTHSQVDRMRKLALESPHAPEDVEFRNLLAHELGALAGRQVPRWVKRVCLHRDQFESCVLRVHAAEGLEENFFFVVAMQSPFVLGLLKLHVAEEVTVNLINDDVLDVQTFLSTDWAHRWEIPCMTTIDAAVELFRHPDLVEVISDCTWLLGLTLVSHADAVPLADWLADDNPEDVHLTNLVGCHPLPPDQHLRWQNHGCNNY